MYFSTDIPLRWAYQFFCMVLSDHTVHNILIWHNGARQSLNVTLPLYIKLYITFSISTKMLDTVLI